MEKVNDTMKAMLNEPLPDEAVRPHPTKSFLSSINSIYVTERLNKVFGVGGWTTRVEFVDKAVTKTNGVMVVVKTTLEAPEFGIHYECYGGNDNADLGDAYKGAVTDALTKIGSWLGIGAHVWKDKPNKNAPKPQPAKYDTKPQPKPQEPEMTPSVDTVIAEVYKCKTVHSIEDMYRKHSSNYSQDDKDKLIAACKAAKAFIEKPSEK